MRRFNPVMSTLVAAAEVNGFSAASACIRGYEREGEARMECLKEAKHDLEVWMADLTKAIEAEAQKVSA